VRIWALLAAPVLHWWKPVELRQTTPRRQATEKGIEAPPGSWMVQFMLKTKDGRLVLPGQDAEE